MEMPRGTLGATIYRLRMERIGSQKDFARRVGVSSSYISEIEHGRIFPSRELLWKIADVLNEPRGFLMNLSAIQKTNILKEKSARYEELKKATV